MHLLIYSFHLWFLGLRMNVLQWLVLLWNIRILQFIINNWYSIYTFVFVYVVPWLCIAWSCVHGFASSVFIYYVFMNFRCFGQPRESIFQWILLMRIVVEEQVCSGVFIWQELYISIHELIKRFLVIVVPLSSLKHLELVMKQEVQDGMDRLPYYLLFLEVNHELRIHL